MGDLRSADSVPTDEVQIPGFPLLPRDLSLTTTQAISSHSPEATELVLERPSGDESVVVLGRGSAGVVVRGTLRTGQAVAVKLYYPAGIGGSPAAQWAGREYRYGSRNFGPNVVRVLARLAIAPIGNRPGQAAIHALVMELVAGPTLAEYANRRRTATPEVVERCLRGMLTGARRLAAEGITIRDIKPQNVGLTSPDATTAEVVLLDHGGARAVDAVSIDPSLMSFPFVAPELVLRGPKRTSPSADVFSIGATTVAMAVGGRPFHAIDDRGEEGLELVLFGKPVLDHPNISPKVRAVLCGALVKDPDSRPDATTLLAVLDEQRPADRDWDPYTAATRPPDEPDVPTTMPMGHNDPPRRTPDPKTTQVLPARGETRRLRPHRTVTPPRRTGDKASRLRTTSSPVTLLTPAEGLPLLNSSTLFHNHPRSWLIDFSGADSTMMSSPQDRVLFSGAGLMFIVYLVYIVAGLTGFVSTMGVPWFFGTVAGIAVGSAMVSFDRGIVAAPRSSLKNLNDPSLEADPVGKPTRGIRGKMMLRVLIALLFALAVGEPVALLVFDHDIAYQLAQNSQQSTDVLVNGEWDTTFIQPLRQLDIQDAKDRAEQDRARALPSTLHRRALEEAAGKGATHRGSCGPVCRQYLDRESAAIADLPNHLNAIQTAINARARQREELQARYDRARKDKAEADARNNGFISRESALLQLLEHPVVLVRYVIIVLTLLVVELMGVLTKLMASGSLYERDQAHARHVDARNNMLRIQRATEINHQRSQDNLSMAQNKDKLRSSAQEAVLDIELEEITLDRSLDIEELRLSRERDRARIAQQHRRRLEEDGLEEYAKPANAPKIIQLPPDPTRRPM